MLKERREDVIWFLTVFVFKGAFIFFTWGIITTSFNAADPNQTLLAQFWGYPWGDTESYFLPIDNLLSHGSYYPDYRMPGYGAIYFVSRIIFSANNAFRALVVLQCFLSIVANFILAKTIMKLTKSKALFLITLFLGAISLKSIRWDFLFMSESLTTSFLIFSVFFLVNFLESNKPRYLLLSGAFLTWSIFMKPIFAPLFLIYLGLILFFFFRRATTTDLLKYILWLTAPFIVIDSLWVGRNYVLYHRFVPLTKQTYMPELEETYLASLVDFVIAYGGNVTFHNPNGELAWFLPARKIFEDKPIPNNYFPLEPPDFIYTSQFNKDSLLTQKKLIAIVEDTATTVQQRKCLISKISESFTAYRLSIREERPFLYYLKSRATHFKRFIITSGTDFLPPLKFSAMSFEQKILKILYGSFYVLTILLGFSGILYAIVSKSEFMSVALPAAYSIVAHPAFGVSDSRYLLTVYPFLIACSIFCVYKIFWGLNRKTDQ